MYKRIFKKQIYLEDGVKTLGLNDTYLLLFFLGLCLVSKNASS
ncbi:MAG: hypothetical protein POELPBGB_00287 [Bacteroidia bacterium]|nr:hypothetical protein [Bacteroidia bacterium]